MINIPSYAEFFEAAANGLEIHGCTGSNRVGDVFPKGLDDLFVHPGALQASSESFCNRFGNEYGWHDGPFWLFRPLWSLRTLWIFRALRILRAFRTLRAFWSLGMHSARKNCVGIDAEFDEAVMDLWEVHRCAGLVGRYDFR
jgi:hypothetical protein